MSTWIVGAISVLGLLALGYWASRSSREDETLEGAHGVRIRRYPMISSTHTGYAVSWNVRDILYGPNRGTPAADYPISWNENGRQYPPTRVSARRR